MPIASNVLIKEILQILDVAYPEHPMDLATEGNPYKVLTACILSLRTKDETCIPAAKRMFTLADTPQKMMTVPIEQLEKAIYPVGFYKTKAKSIIEFSKIILEKYHGQVPNTMDGLLSLKGVGRKTANLVLGLGFGLPAICVDIHVHRICNRLGYITTQTPEETEMVLRKQLPKDCWHLINKVMVLHGQQICRPVGPMCSACPVQQYCQRVQVNPRKGYAV